jgi:hypothetical protein
MTSPQPAPPLPSLRPVQAARALADAALAAAGARAQPLGPGQSLADSPARIAARDFPGEAGRASRYARCPCLRPPGTGQAASKTTARPTGGRVMTGLLKYSTTCKGAVTGLFPLREGAA